MSEPERCQHCKGPIYFGVVITGEWTHDHGDRYCHDGRNFTSTPLKTATPTFHGPEDVL